MKKGRISAALLLIGVVVLLGGCTSFDASAYTQAVLDVSYKNETEKYIELTGASEEEAEVVFQENLDSTMEEFKTMELSEELEKNYRSLFEDIIKQVKYTVGEAVKTEEGNYTVDVTVEPITLFEDTYEEFQTKAEAYAADITNAVMSGEEMPSDEEMQADVYRLYYEILNAGVMSGMKYGEPEVVTIHINKTDDGTYEIAGEDIRALDEKLISQEIGKG